jgi:hypothetical protein
MRYDGARNLQEPLDKHNESGTDLAELLEQRLLRRLRTTGKRAKCDFWKLYKQLKACRRTQQLHSSTPYPSDGAGN